MDTSLSLRISFQNVGILFPFVRKHKKLGINPESKFGIIL